LSKRSSGEATPAPPQVKKRVYAVWWPTDGHRGGAGALKTPEPLLRRVRDHVIAAALAEADKPPRPAMSVIVLVARRADESRALGNQEVIFRCGSI